MPVIGAPTKFTVISAVNISSVSTVGVLLSSQVSIFDAVIAEILQAVATTIVTLAISQIVLSTSKQMVYSTVYIPDVEPASTFMVPSVLIVTPVKPPSLLITIVVSSILASVAVAPSAKSVPLPLSLNTLLVVPPKTGSIGTALKSSSNAKIVRWAPQSSTVAGIIHSNTLPVPEVNPPVLPSII